MKEKKQKEQKCLLAIWRSNDDNQLGAYLSIATKITRKLDSLDEPLKSVIPELAEELDVMNKSWSIVLSINKGHFVISFSDRRFQPRSKAMTDFSEPIQELLSIIGEALSDLLQASAKDSEALLSL